MKVINTLPHLCYLLSQNDELYLYVLCWRGQYAMESFTTLIQLNESEKVSYKSSGIECFENLAKKVQVDASEFSSRAIHDENLASYISAAVQKWLAENG
jgi:hypothetical protein